MVMQKLRKYTKFFLWIVVAGFVGWIFFELGANIVGKRLAKPWERGIIAEVDGTKVPYELFRRMYQVAIQDSIKKKGRELTDAEEEKLEEAVWQKLISDIKWREVINSRKLHLYDQTVVEVIKSSPPSEFLQMEQFQTEGKFDPNKYLLALQDPRNLPFFVSYERTLREEIPKEIFRADFFMSIPVARKEMDYIVERNSIKILADYIGIRFVDFPEENIKVSEDEMKSFFDENKEIFEFPARVNLRVVRFDKLPSKEDTLSAVERLKTALAELKEGASFEDISEYYNEDEYTRDQGGLIGWIKKKGPLGKLFEEAKKLKKGEISEPVLTKFGWHLIKVEEKRRDSIKVRHILVKIRTSVDTKAALKEEAERLVELAKEIGFEPACESLKLKYVETGFFKVGSFFIPMVGRSEGLGEFAKRAKPGEISSVIWDPKFYAVAKVHERKEKGVPSFEEVKLMVESNCKREKIKEKVKEIMDSAYVLLKKGKTMEEVRDIFKEYGMKVWKSVDFRWRISVPGIGFSWKFYGVLYGTEEGEITEPVEADGGGIFIGKVLKKSKLGEDETKKVRERVLSQYLRAILNRTWNNWANNLISKAHIKDYRSYLLY